MVSLRLLLALFRPGEIVEIVRRKRLWLGFFIPVAIRQNRHFLSRDLPTRRQLRLFDFLPAFGKPKNFGQR
jgi:hypothetical protein